MTAPHYLPLETRIISGGGSLAIMHRGSRRQIPLTLITHLEADGNYCWIYTKAGEYFLTSQRFGAIKQTSGFWQVHRSYLVNPAFVVSSFRAIRSSNTLILTTGVLVPVARNRKKQTCELLRQLSQSQNQ